MSRRDPERHTEAEPLDAQRLYGLHVFTVRGFARDILVYEKVIAATSPIEAENAASQQCAIAVERFHVTPLTTSEVI